MAGPRIRIDGLQAIARHLKLHPNHIRKLYQITVPEEHRLPVFTLSPSGNKNATLYAWKDELEAWLERKARLFFEHGPIR